VTKKLINNQTPFEPTWDSLVNYVVPDWFRNAKFGIWAHWGPQCQPQRGDWYARGMYIQGEDRYREHIDQYAHPSQFGFKDVIHEWKAERWDPTSLMKLYKAAGAEYFVALANHHDNFDLWDSTYQTWNSTKIGPKRDIVEEWAAAARHQGLHFGLSVHASHAWSWYEPAQGSDREGPLTGVPYDGVLTKEDGAGCWWSGLDPQELYAQDHAPTPMDANMWSVLHYWEWENGYPAPSKEYCEKFFNRTVELIDRFKPELIYFDDTVLPLYPVSDVGLRITAHYYNSHPNAVVNGKILSEEQKKALVWDIERGQSSEIEPLPWQTCTCLGDWHYKQSIYDENGYKSAAFVVQMLVDVVSKNGNLLLSVPLRGDGSLDEKEVAILEDLTEWMTPNRECFVGTRPWKVCGEGPSLMSAKPLTAQGFNEGTADPNTAADLRFTCKDDCIYVIALGRPRDVVVVSSMGSSVGHLDRPVQGVTMLGEQGQVSFELTAESLAIHVPAGAGNDVATVFKVQF
jgi:alpha-L-fucosidase